MRTNQPLFFILALYLQNVESKSYIYIYAPNFFDQRRVRPRPFPGGGGVKQNLAKKYSIEHLNVCIPLVDRMFYR